VQQQQIDFGQPQPGQASLTERSRSFGAKWVVQTFVVETLVAFRPMPQGLADLALFS